MLHVLFLIFELMFFYGIRNMKYGRKFPFGGIYLSKFILRLKFEKNSRFFSNFKLIIMIFEVYDTKSFDLL